MIKTSRYSMWLDITLNSSNFVLLDSQQICPLFQNSCCKRGAYIRLDRHRLAYLPWIVKLTCWYCSYANGLLQYAVRIAGDTESYFCPLNTRNAQANFTTLPTTNISLNTVMFMSLKHDINKILNEYGVSFSSYYILDTHLKLFGLFLTSQEN